MTKHNYFFSIYWRNIKTVVQQDPLSLRREENEVYDGAPGVSVYYLYDKKRILSEKTNKTIQEKILSRLLNKHDGRGLIGPFLDIRVLAWFLVIPNLVIYPLIKTIIDFCTRNFLDERSITELNHQLDEIFNDESEFDFLIKKICVNSRYNYQSSESKLLISELEGIKDEAVGFSPLLNELAKCYLETYRDVQNEAEQDKNLDDFCKTLTLQDLLNRKCKLRMYVGTDRETNVEIYQFGFFGKEVNQEWTEKQKNIFCNVKDNEKKLFKPNGIRIKSKRFSDELHYYSLKEYPIANKDYRQKQLDVLKAYINNPINNGKKLMQDIQTEATVLINKSDKASQRSGLNVGLRL